MSDATGASWDYDVFISHASEDKADVARPLAEALETQGLRVWLDEQELTLGDVLSRKIDLGLANSRFGVVVLSPSFFAKHWPRRELDGLVARETVDGTKVILPVWHRVGLEQVVAESPTLASRLAISTDAGVESVATAILEAAEAVKDRSEETINVVSAIQDSSSALSAARVHDAVLDNLRRGDRIGLDELLRAERSRAHAAIDAVTADYFQRHTDPDAVADGGKRLMSVAQLRAAVLIPLALYDAERLKRELRTDTGWMSRTELRGGGMTWQQAWRVPWWAAAMVVGGMACRNELFEAAAVVARVKWQDNFAVRQSLVGHPGELALAFAEADGPAPPQGQQWVFPQWQWLSSQVGSWGWLVDRYPDWFSVENEPAASFAEFDFLDGLAAQFAEEGTVVAFWSLELSAMRRFAHRLRADDEARTDFALAVGVTLERFDAEAPGLVAAQRGLGPFARTSEVAEVLAGHR